MTYRPGTYGLSVLGVADDEPRFICDGCGLVYRLRTDRPPPKWFNDGKSPRGWWRRGPSDAREAYCPKCVMTGRAR